MYGVIDVGTTNLKLAIYDEELKKTFSQLERNKLLESTSDCKEQDGKQILDVVKHYLNVLKDRGVNQAGFSFNRSSLVVWAKNGTPMSNVITWMDPRGIEVSNNFSLGLKMLSHFPVIGSILSPQSSAVRMKWFLSNVENLIEKIHKGDAFIGTLDSFVLYNLTGRYVSDYTNIALTGLFHPSSLKFIDMTYSLLKLPKEIRPEPVNNICDLGSYEGISLNTSIADQQSACVAEGLVGKSAFKMTHGTGSFVDVSVKKLPGFFGKGILPLILFKNEKEVYYGLEGFLPTSGSVVDWLVGNGLFSSYEEIDKLASLPVRGSSGITFAPTLNGSNIPYFPSIKGMLTGLETGTTKSEIASALYEGISSAVAEITERLEGLTKFHPSTVRCDGGLTKSDSFLQILASTIRLRVTRGSDVDATSKGVVFLLKLYNGEVKLSDAEELFAPSFEATPDERFNGDIVRGRFLKVLKSGSSFK